MTRDRNPTARYHRTPGSGDEESKAELGRVEIEKVVVALGPPARCDVIAESAHCSLLGVRADGGPHRDPSTDLLERSARGSGMTRYSEVKPHSAYVLLSISGKSVVYSPQPMCA